MRGKIDFNRRADRLEWGERILSIQTEAQFALAAMELFQIQRKENPVYRRLCESRKISSRIDWREIPAVPQRLFKEASVFSGKKASLEFHTSGTTTGFPGVHRLRDDLLYRAAAEAGFPWDRNRKWQMIFLHPSIKESPHSSLSQMLQCWSESYGNGDAVAGVQRGELQVEFLEKKLNSMGSTPILLAGTAFSFVQLFEARPEWRLKLPRFSVVMETGGYKGRSRELKKPELYRKICRHFGVQDQQIWNEYGMTELSSQAYAQGAKGEHLTPPWARTLVMDPVREREVKRGETGVVRWIDLANVDSVLAVQTLDLAVRTRNGFRLLGRAPTAERRGCSLVMDFNSKK